jgi:hypothetical protein
MTIFQMNLVSVSSKLKEHSFQYKMLPQSLPNSERKIIALLLFLNFDAFTPCVAPRAKADLRKIKSWSSQSSFQEKYE